MDHREAEAVAADWIKSWNAHDVEAVLAKFTDGVVFSSEKAVAIVGTGHIVGKDQLRAYWLAALERVGDLHFKLDHVGFDAETQELFIVYLATLAGQTTRACERLRFDDGGVIDGEALYGAPL